MPKNPFLFELRLKHERELNVLREERKNLQQRKNDLIQKQKQEVIESNEKWKRDIESPDYDVWLYNKDYSITEAEKFRIAARAQLYKDLLARLP
jgi:hypothetical protein